MEFKDAEGGTYKMIGDGLRKRPDSLTNDSNIGPMKVINGSSVYFTVFKLLSNSVK